MKVGDKVRLRKEDYKFLGNSPKLSLYGHSVFTIKSINTCGNLNVSGNSTRLSFFEIPFYWQASKFEKIHKRKREG